MERQLPREQLQLPRGEFFGQVSRSRRVADFSLAESTYSAAFAVPSHSHEYASFCLVLQGHFTETYRKNALLCRPSSLLFYPAGEPHQEQFHSSGTRCFLIEVRPSWFKQFPSDSTIVDHAINFQGGKASGLVIQVYKEFRALDEFSKLSIEGLMLELIAEVSRNSRLLADRTPGPKVEQVRELIHSHFPEPLTLAAIAKQVEMHPVHLAQAFRRAFGSTIGQYIRRLRIEYACRELANFDIPIVQIANAAGFFDQSHFTRTFRHLMGVTPSEFRRNLAH